MSEEEKDSQEKTKKEIIGEFKNQGNLLIQAADKVIAVLENCPKPEDGFGINISQLTPDQREEVRQANQSFFDLFEQVQPMFVTIRPFCRNGREAGQEIEHDSSAYLAQYKTIAEMLGLYTKSSEISTKVVDEEPEMVKAYLPCLDPVFVKQARVVIESFFDELGEPVPARNFDFLQVLKDTQSLFLALNANLTLLKRGALHPLHVLIEAPAHLEILGEESNIRRIFNNIVGNAVKAVKPTRNHEEGEIEIKADLVENMVVTTVSDNGTGVDIKKIVQAARAQGVELISSSEAFRALNPKNRKEFLDTMVFLGATGYAEGGQSGTGRGMKATRKAIEAMGEELWLKIIFREVLSLKQ